MNRKDYIDECLEYGLKSWAACHAPDTSRRAALLRAADTTTDQAIAPDRQAAWMEARRRYRSRPTRPVTDPMESFGFSWIWALHLTVTPLSSMR